MCVHCQWKKIGPTLLQQRAYKKYSAVGRNTNYSQTLRDPRPHGHDRNLALCVNEPACWKSTPILQATVCPDRDFSLLGSKTYGNTPASNVQLSTSGVLPVHVGSSDFLKSNPRVPTKPSALLVQPCFSAERILADAGPVAADSALRKKMTKLLSLLLLLSLLALLVQTCFSAGRILADAGPVAADSALRQKLTKLLSLAQTLRTIEHADRFLLLSLLALLVQKYKYRSWKRRQHCSLRHLCKSRGLRKLERLRPQVKGLGFRV